MAGGGVCCSLFSAGPELAGQTEPSRLPTPSNYAQGWDGDRAAAAPGPEGRCGQAWVRGVGAAVTISEGCRAPWGPVAWGCHLM